LLLVISGPSGTGKGTICRALMAKNPQIKYSVSATTRSPREGEEDGVHYYFLTKAKFEDMLKENEFLEHAAVYDNYYGTPKNKVMESLEKGEDIILEIDIQGALQLKQVFPGGIFIFIVPPSLEELRERIEGRGTDSKDVIEKRLNCAGQELGYVDRYDYVVINDNIDKAVDKMEAIIKAEKCKPVRCNYQVK